MNRASLVITAALLVSLLVCSVSANSASAQVILGCTTCVYIQPSPIVTQLGDYTEVQVAVQNPQDYSAEGLVYAIVHDSEGQTVANSTGVLDLGPDSNGTATVLIFGLRLGTLYSATIFAKGVDGAGISPPETVNLTPEQGAGTVDGGAPLGTNTFLIGINQGCQPIFVPCAEYTNASNSTIYGVVYLVLHNSLGQTVDISTALMVSSPGQTQTVLLPIVGANGSASVFAVSVDQYAISPLATASFVS